MADVPASEARKEPLSSDASHGERPAILIVGGLGEPLQQDTKLIEY